MLMIQQSYPKAVAENEKDVPAQEVADHFNENEGKLSSQKEGIDIPVTAKESEPTPEKSERDKEMYLSPKHPYQDDADEDRHHQMKVSDNKQQAKEEVLSSMDVMAKIFLQALSDHHKQLLPEDAKKSVKQTDKEPQKIDLNVMEKTVQTEESDSSPIGGDIEAIYLEVKPNDYDNEPQKSEKDEDEKQMGTVESPSPVKSEEVPTELKTSGVFDLARRMYSAIANVLYNQSSDQIGREQISDEPEEAAVNSEPGPEPQISKVPAGKEMEGPDRRPSAKPKSLNEETKPVSTYAILTPVKALEDNFVPASVKDELIQTDDQIALIDDHGNPTIIKQEIIPVTGQPSPDENVDAPTVLEDEDERSKGQPSVFQDKSVTNE